MLILAVPACLLLIWLCTVMGAASVSAGEVNRILLHEIFHLPVDMEGISEGSIAIIRDVRLPRVLLVYAISRRGKRVPVSSLLLSGIAVNQSLSAFMSLLMLFNQQSMEQIMFWTMGSLNGKGWNQILSILPYVLGGWLMRLVGLFSDSQKALLMAARAANILIGMGFYWYVAQIGRKLFPRRTFRYFFLALLSMLPQLLYLF